MAHTTLNGVTTADATADAGGASLPASRQDRLLRTAERIVRALAPPPDEAGAAYTQAAADTEVAVFGYLVTTDEGKTSSEGVGGISTSFRSYLEFVRPIVADGMDDFYVGGKVANTGYVEDFAKF